MESFLGHKSRRAVGGFVTAVLLASVLSVAAVSAQTSATSECSGDFVSEIEGIQLLVGSVTTCLLYTSPSPRDRQKSRMPSSA